MTTRKLKATGMVLIGATAALAALLAAPPAGAVPEIMAAYGDQWAWHGAEINGMAGSGAAMYRGGLSNIFNPAYLAEAQGVRLDAGLSLDQEHEDRFQPLFDSFDSYVADAAIASNRHHHFQTGFGLAYRAGGDGMPVGIALSLTDRYPYAYTFDEELRNPSPYQPRNPGDPVRDQIIENRLREVTGTLRDLSLGVGVGLHERISAGAAVHYGFGTRKEQVSVRDFVDDANSYLAADEFEMSGVNFTVGVRGVVNERVEVGLAWESRLDATGDRTLSMSDAATDTSIVHDGRYKYPNIFRGGLAFRPRTDPATVFTVELEYVPWSEMEDDAYGGADNPEQLQDITDVRIGLQHTFYNGMPLRFGFRHYQSYADRDAGSSAFSAGIGMPVADGMLAASLELSKLTSVQPHQFPYPSDYFGNAFYSDPEARVEDTRFRIGVGFSRQF